MPEPRPAPAHRVRSALHERYRRAVLPIAVAIGADERTPRHLPQIVRIDKGIQRLSRGRLTLLDLAGLPSLTLIVPGRKSGQLRETPLLAVPHEGGWLVAGSNFGGTRRPVWVLNVVAADEPRVRVGGREHRVVVHEATGSERDRLYDVMTRTWPNFAKYQERTDRVIRVFRLDPR
ncbi:nitroreductase family deazaflavin-dependent oxidoreductase [Nocardioides piscis]|uniref:Nitroreductase family deazaflavin-dependent oxidoreductase n=1 Tax=Nocardioides piscis TaxID=2714938 RepID=A0A6G7YD47_9ACTN|nr:nitroreductase family deazaflavin-dependent oxidoreductase [Nocardioides piscis]QIK74824.1 nitroreductase family deazaflavin-dependent oxidoreductase [Nocardioides piscis]